MVDATHLWIDWFLLQMMHNIFRASYEKMLINGLRWFFYESISENFRIQVHNLVSFDFPWVGLSGLYLRDIVTGAPGRWQVSWLLLYTAACEFFWWETYPDIFWRNMI